MSDFPFRRAPDKYKRKPKERKEEAEKAKKHFDSSDIQGIRNKLGLSKTHKEWKIKKEMIRLSKKPSKTWRLIGLTKEDFAMFGIKV
jgi:hypothetical protein